MNSTTAKVINGFMKLNEAEQKEFIAKVNDYINGRVNATILNEELRKSIYGVTFGPSPNVCPCCGR